MKTEPKFKEGDKVSFLQDNKRREGVVRVRDHNLAYGAKSNFLYDVESDIGWVKHIPEEDLNLTGSSRYYS